MEERMLFREKLGELKELADERDGHLTQEDVRKVFEGMPLKEEHYTMIYAYLAGEKISVEGFEGGRNAAAEETEPVPEEAEGETEESEPDPLSFYYEELQEVEELSEDEKWKAFQLAAAGDQLAKARLTRCYLPTVYDLAKTYQYEGTPLGDLVQEGNIALMLALEELEVGSDAAEYEKLLYGRIQEAIEDYLQENRDMQDLGDHLAKRVDHLKEAVDNLERDLEHRVSVDELSAYLEMPREEILDILRMAGDEIKVNL